MTCPEKMGCRGSGAPNLPCSLGGCLAHSRGETAPQPPPLARPQRLVRDLIKEPPGICIISESGWDAPGLLRRGVGGAGRSRPRSSAGWGVPVRPTDARKGPGRGEGTGQGKGTLLYWSRPGIPHLSQRVPPPPPLTRELWTQLGLGPQARQAEGPRASGPPAPPCPQANSECKHSSPCPALGSNRARAFPQVLGACPAAGGSRAPGLWPSGVGEGSEQSAGTRWARPPGSQCLSCRGQGPV